MTSRTPSTMPAGGWGRLVQWWLNRPVRVKGLIAIAVPLLALLVTASASLGLQYREQHARIAGRASVHLIGTADRVLANALDAETAVRGYAATRDVLFLQPYYATRHRMGASRAAFAAAAVRAGDAPRERPANATTRRVMAKLEQIRVAVARGAPASTITALLRQGRRAMDRLRAQITSTRIRATRMMLSQHSAVDRAEAGVDVITVVGVGLGLLAGLAGVALFASGISRRVAAAALNADRLGEGKPVVAADHSDDEIGRLADSLAAAEKVLASRSAQLVAARDEALRANQAKNAFLSSTSHELRTPLNSILGFTQLLELSDLGAEDRESVQRILAAGRHLLGLINELIDIARIEAGELTVSLEPVLVGALLGDVCELMAPLAAERDIDLRQQCTRPGLAVCADWQRLSQIMVNLISNAVKYNRRGGTITIACQEHRDGQVTIAVTDTGPGLSGADLDRIFVPFERLAAENSDVEGTGIGLPLARALARVMHGEVRATSTLGQGSTFTVSLRHAHRFGHVPSQAARPGLPSSGSSAEPWAGSALTLLYIEDNPANVEVVARYLRDREHTRLVTAGSGAEGLRAAARHQPDIVLLDLHLPDISGDQVLGSLVTEPETGGIPVAVLSADASPRVIARLLAAGAFAYLTKPLDLARLSDLLHSFEASARHVSARAATRKR